MERTPPKIHYADIEKSQTPYVAKVSSLIIAESSEVLILKEVADEYKFDPVVYFPKNAIKQNYFNPTDHHTDCSLKGRASYYTVTIGDTKLENVAWFYPTPNQKVAQIKDYIAFYDDKVEITQY